MNIIQAQDAGAVFNTLLYGGNSNLAAAAQHRIDSYISSMRNAGRAVGNLITTIRDYVYNPDRILEAKQVLNTTSAYIAEDVIYPILDSNTVPSPYMQAMIMQNSQIWQLYQDGEIYGYENSRLFDRYDDNIEMSINSGWIDEDVENPIYISSDEFEPDLMDQINLRDTWRYMLHAIDTDVVDPTSIEE